MRLDDTVCRGSLIVHRGVTYVVLGKGALRDERSSRPYASGWRVRDITSITDRAVIACIHTVAKDAEVDAFFPGDVFPLSEFII